MGMGKKREYEDQRELWKKKGRSSTMGFSSVPAIHILGTWTDLCTPVSSDKQDGMFDLEALSGHS